ncbi:membrane protein insertase YidC [Bacteroides pyogenes]|uniref:membrane protein insertase YidC n=1 Tax=Bacteroides pyogenes TaxID=310300 RepID=UPI001F353AF7|nr:membrane protein insertase YidC [Bacteroides pyogenes]MCE9107440.1 membrane protein insertase YidC [Bacteroides pyogenes]
MDKNTITGLVLIGILLIGFSILSRPSQEQLAAQKRYYDSIALVQQQEEALKAKTEAALANEKKAALAEDSSSLFFNAAKGTESPVIIANNVAEITLTTKGGRVRSAMLKEYKGQDKQTPVVLFNEEDAAMSFNFYNKQGAIQTKDYYFTPVNKTDSSVVMRLEADADSYIDFIYTLKQDSYLMDFRIQATGMADKLANTEYVDIEWSQKARQLEKGFGFENRLAELTYKLSEGKVDNLSAAKDDEKKLEGRADWIAFKNQFFSSALIAAQDFDKVSVRSRLQKEGSGYVKDYSAEMNTFFDPTGARPTELFFYLGPNHFKTLKALDKGREEKWKLHRLVYLGWPVVRTINQYITINVFDWLTRWGLSMGVVLLILTLLVKAAVYPATWKTYMSSAKMRVLKPKIEVINKKYPKQEDAMKKQQEVMALYSQYGVSPMGGCLPMILQFPILMALFMFVPSAIELRQESFLWADDLSTYDAFIHFPFHIPFLGSHLSLFCVLMTVTNILNTKYTMSMQDTGAQPQMAAMKWMSYLMPVMLLFVLNSYPAGLNYYYFLSTLISVGTMIMLRRTTDEEKLLAILEAKKKDPKQMKTSGFAARLEAMQKQQEQLMKERQQKQNRNKK